MRIVSLLPGNTEMVCALGLQDALVGVSHECDYPPAVRDLPIVTNSRINAAGSQTAIQEQVARIGREGGSLYTIDEHLLWRLEPDLILTQARCAVCAIDYDEVLAIVGRLWPKDPPVVLSFQPNSIWEMLADIHRIGRAADCEPVARQVVSELLGRIQRVLARVAQIPVLRRPRVVFLEWTEPLMSCGGTHFEMIQLAGGRCQISRYGEKAAWTTPEAIVAAAPDVVVIGACGLGTAANHEAGRQLAETEWFRQLPAVKNNRVYAVDGNAYFNRPGPRLVDSLEILADICIDHIDRWNSQQVLRLELQGV